MIKIVLDAALDYNEDFCDTIRYETPCHRDQLNSKGSTGGYKC